MARARDRRGDDRQLRRAVARAAARRGSRRCRSATPTATRATCASAEVLVRGRRAPDRRRGLHGHVHGRRHRRARRRRVGDAVTLIGARRRRDDHRRRDLARWAGTVSYEILCGISKRVPRVYKDAAATSATSRRSRGRDRLHDRSLVGRHGSRAARARTRTRARERLGGRWRRRCAVADLRLLRRPRASLLRTGDARGCSGGPFRLQAVPRADGVRRRRVAAHHPAGRLLLGRGRGPAGDRRAGDLPAGALRRARRSGSRWRRSWRRSSRR